MKKTLTTNQIADELTADFSYNAARALAEYLEDYEDGTGEEMELDTVAIRCEWSEYDSLQDWAKDYFSDDWLDKLGIEPEDGAGEIFDEDEVDDAIREYIEDCGTLIEFSGGVLVSSF